MKKLLLVSVLMLLSLTSAGCGKSGEPIRKTALKLNTVVQVTIYDSQDESLLDGCMEVCDRYEQLLSRTVDTSEISRLNSGEMDLVSEETAGLIRRGLYYGDLSEGAFDIAIEPVSRLWDFTAETPSLPDREDLEKALPLVDYRGVHVDGCRVTFDQAGMGIELGAIAKGYIADRLKEYLLANGVKSAVINLGGNVLCVGSRPDGKPFQIGIQKPYAGYQEITAVAEITDLSVVSSGIYERYITVDNKQYHHILDPKTGMPFDNGLVAVTVFTKDSTDGDALSTACFALGMEKGMELLENLDGVYGGIFITKDYELHYTEGLKSRIKITETPNSGK